MHCIIIYLELSVSELVVYNIKHYLLEHNYTPAAIVQSIPSVGRLYPVSFGVLSRLPLLILTYKNLNELVQLMNEEMGVTTGEFQKRLTVIQAKIDNTSQHLERLYHALETGSLKLTDLAPRIQRLRQT